MNTHLSGLAEDGLGAAGCRCSHGDWREHENTYPERVAGDPRRAMQDLNVSYRVGISARYILSEVVCTVLLCALSSRFLRRASVMSVEARNIFWLIYERCKVQEMAQMSPCPPPANQSSPPPQSPLRAN